MLRFLFILAVLIGGGWFVAAPYITGISLQMAVEESDVTRSEPYLEKKTIQESLARQLQTTATALRVPHSKRPLPQLIGGLSQTHTPSQTAALLTTNEGLDALSTGRSEMRGYELRGATLGRPPRVDTHTSWRSLDTFVATVTTNDIDPVEFVFHRSGFANWKLEDIRLPLGN